MKNKFLKLTSLFGMIGAIGMLPFTLNCSLGNDLSSKNIIDSIRKITDSLEKISEDMKKDNQKLKNVISNIDNAIKMIQGTADKLNSKATLSQQDLEIIKSKKIQLNEIINKINQSDDLDLNPIEKATLKNKILHLNKILNQLELKNVL